MTMNPSLDVQDAAGEVPAAGDPAAQDLAATTAGSLPAVPADAAGEAASPDATPSGRHAVADDDPTGAAVPTDETVEAAPDTVEVLAAAVARLGEAVEEGRRTQEAQRAMLEKLHEERQELREAEQRRLRDPVVRELIQLSDTCLRNGRQWLGRTDVSTETAQAVSGVLLDTVDDIRLTLERQGVESFAPAADERFDRAACKAVGVQPTTDPVRDGLVVEVRKPGYRMGERVVRFSEVVVWRLTPGVG
jgi:molecular chaperone GrpE (heat shock protein)